MHLNKLCVAIALSIAAPATAQEATHESDNHDTVTRLTLAQEILRISYPEETREPMFRAVGEQMEAQALQSLAANITDEGALEVIAEWQDSLRQQTGEILRRNIPLLMDGWAQSFAKVYSEEELRDILAFVSTDTGRSFMLKSTDVISHPQFAAANQKYIDETTAVTLAAMPDLISQMAAYKESREGAE